MPTVGVIILGTEGMKRLAECLESVAWADEVLLLHTGAMPPGPRMLAGKPIKFKAVNSLVAAAAWREIDSEWILRLWGEERVEPQLREELQALRQGSLKAGGSTYRIPVRSYLLGGWAVGSVSGASPAHRLYRKSTRPDSGWWSATEEAGVLGQGWIGDYSCSELSRAVEHIQFLSDYWAGQLGVVAPPPPAIRAVAASLRVFLRILFDNGIFFRGLAGIALAALAGYAVLLSGAKSWEAKHLGTRGNMPGQAP